MGKPGAVYLMDWCCLSIDMMGVEWSRRRGIKYWSQHHSVKTTESCCCVGNNPENVTERAEVEFVFTALCPTSSNWRICSNVWHQSTGFCSQRHNEVRLHVKLKPTASERPSEPRWQRLGQSLSTHRLMLMERVKFLSSSLSLELRSKTVEEAA